MRALVVEVLSKLSPMFTNGDRRRGNFKVGTAKSNCGEENRIVDIEFVGEQDFSMMRAC